MAEATVERNEAEGVGAFVLVIDGDRAGTLDYHRAAPHVVHVDYVEVSPHFRGTGLGRRLIEAAADWARESGITLVPICGYARAVLTSDPVFADVIGSEAPPDRLSPRLGE